MQQKRSHKLIYCICKLPGGLAAARAVLHVINRLYANFVGSQPVQRPPRQTIAEVCAGIPSEFRCWREQRRSRRACKRKAVATRMDRIPVLDIRTGMVVSSDEFWYPRIVTDIQLIVDTPMWDDCVVLNLGFDSLGSPYKPDGFKYNMYCRMNQKLYLHNYDQAAVAFSLLAETDLDIEDSLWAVPAV